MNDKEMNESFWDDDGDEDDEYNDLESDIDANNDETFDNAADWNEDEHEELIARDSILSQSRQPPSRSNVNLPQFQADAGRQVLRVDELERQLLKTRINQNAPPPEPQMPQMPHTNASEAHKRTGWSPFGGKDLFTNPDSSRPAQAGADDQRPMMNANPPYSLTLSQQQQLLLQHHQMLQRQILQHQQLEQMAMLKQEQLQQEQRLMSTQCYTVEELERQMMADRSSAATETSGSTRNTNERIQNETPKSLTLNDRHEIKRNTHERRDGERGDRFDRLDRDVRDTARGYRERRDNRDSRDRRDLRDNRDHRDHRDHRDQKDHRDNRDHRQHNRRRLTIIPPQVQLSVIDKAKRMHSITAMHPDEFLQDRMPTSKGGFLFKRHSRVSGEKGIHDGVLTEKERNWLTKIQEKIQADYDDNLDQDYYYLLYFNRFSMSDEAAQKPCGPGVLDRRFIPRERLLYNSNA